MWNASPGLVITSRLWKFLWDGIVDCGIVVWPIELSFLTSDFAPLLLMEEPVLLVTHPKHPIARLQNATQDDVACLVQPFYLLRWWQDHIRI